MMGGRLWHDDEWAILKETRDWPVHDVARRLNRSVSTVISQRVLIDFEEHPEKHRAAVARHEELVRSMWHTHKPYEIAKRVYGTRTAYVLAIAERLGLSDPQARPAPRPKPVTNPECGYSQETIAWAIANLRTDPEARMIACVVAERRARRNNPRAKKEQEQAA